MPGDEGKVVTAKDASNSKSSSALKALHRVDPVMWRHVVPLKASTCCPWYVTQKVLSACDILPAHRMRSLNSVVLQFRLLIKNATKEQAAWAKGMKPRQVQVAEEERCRSV